MTPVKRIEIIVPSIEVKPVLKQLNRLGLSGYSVIRHVSGSGDRGQTNDDLDLGESLGNDYILTTCSAEQEETVIEMIRPILKKYGGVCLISDAKWIIHEDKPLN